MVARRLLAERAAVRGRRLRRADHQRLLAGPRTVLRARRGDPDRARRADEVLATCDDAPRTAPAIAERARARAARARAQPHRSTHRAARAAQALRASRVVADGVRRRAETRCTAMKLVIFGLAVSSSWGNGHATLWRGLSGALLGAGHRSSSSSATCPTTPRIAICTELPRRRAGALSRLGGDRAPRAARELARRRRRHGHVLLPGRRRRRRELVLEPRAPLRVFYDLDTPVTLARLARRRAGRLPRPRAGLRDFDLVLSYTGGARARRAARRGSARGASRRSTARRSASCTARSPPRRATARDLSYLGTYAADRQAALEALFVEPARRAARRALRDRRRAVPGRLSLDARTSTSSATCRRPSTRRSTAPRA